MRVTFISVHTELTEKRRWEFVGVRKWIIGMQMWSYQAELEDRTYTYGVDFNRLSNNLPRNHGESSFRAPWQLRNENSGQRHQTLFVDQRDKPVQSRWLYASAITNLALSFSPPFPTHNRPISKLLYCMPLLRLLESETSIRLRGLWILGTRASPVIMTRWRK